MAAELSAGKTSDLAAELSAGKTFNLADELSDSEMSGPVKFPIMLVLTAYTIQKRLHL